jgi:hypothetical protein
MKDSPLHRPFPIPAFNPFHGGRMAWRLGLLAEYILSLCPPPRIKPRPRLDDLRYVTMAGRAHLLHLRESLISLHRSWQNLPDLVVVSDGSWGREEFLKTFRFWPGPITLMMPQEVSSALAASGDQALAELALRHPYGLKLAAIVLLARTRRMLFIDADVLWFSDPSEMLTRYQARDTPAVTVESNRSFNTQLALAFCPAALESPYVNSGGVLLEGELCDKGLLDSMIAFILNKRDYAFIDQTVAAVAVRLNGTVFPKQFCLVEFDDAFAVSHQRPWKDGYHSRHYVTFMRHQFYRDALQLRWQAFFQRN